MDDASIELLQNSIVPSKWSGLATALDEPEMSARLQEAFAAGTRSDYVIDACALDSVTFLPEVHRAVLVAENRMADRRNLTP